MNYFSKISSEKNYPVWTLFNFVVLAFAGALLRYMHCFSLKGVNYQFLLHSHSHFAFAGWMFLAIILLFYNYFKKENSGLAKYFRPLFGTALLVSFGMLVSFFLTGYKTASIVLSTLFIFIGYGFVWLIFKSRIFEKTNSPANILLKGALFFLVLSSFGPFALGYFGATGLKDSELQQNAIYFYLHFQLNGFMQLALLGFLFKTYLKADVNVGKSTTFWAKMLVFSTLPLYAMFTLWIKPPTWVYVVAFFSALLHFVAWLMLVFRLKADLSPFSFLAKTAVLAVSLQFFFQILIAFPPIGNWAFANHNLIIGYIHLLTLGSLSPLIIDFFAKAGYLKPSVRLNGLFVTDSVIYLVLLFGSAFLTLFQIYIPNLEVLLFATNLAMPVLGIAYFLNSLKSKQELHQSIYKLYNI